MLLAPFLAIKAITKILASNLPKFDKIILTITSGLGGLAVALGALGWFWIPAFWPAFLVVGILAILAGAIYGIVKAIQFLNKKFPSLISWKNLFNLTGISNIIGIFKLLSKVILVIVNAVKILWHWIVGKSPGLIPAFASLGDKLKRGFIPILKTMWDWFKKILSVVRLVLNPLEMFKRLWSAIFGGKATTATIPVIDLEPLKFHLTALFSELYVLLGKGGIYGLLSSISLGTQIATILDIAIIDTLNSNYINLVNAITTNFNILRIEIATKLEDVRSIIRDKLEQVDRSIEATKIDIVSAIGSIRINVTNISNIVGSGISSFLPESPYITPIEGFYGPGFANGGIAMTPVIARVAEKGPEAIIPLNRGGIGTTINIYVTGNSIIGESAADDLGNIISDRILRRIRTVAPFSIR